MADEYRWGPVVKDPDETLPVVLSAFNLCALFWEPNEEYQLGDIVWPTKPIGYCAECTVAGRSGAKEPRWVATADEALPQQDGSVTWTMRHAGSGGISPMTNPEAQAPDGIEVQGLVVNEGTKLLVDYVGGVDGEDYEVKFTFQIAGRQRVGRQIVMVRKK